LFSRGKLTAEEASRTPAAHKFMGGSERNEISFRQPCVHFDGCACRIYSSRYATCREYECELLKGLASGSMDSASARSHIGKAHELIAAVTTNDPEAGTWTGRQKRWAELAAEVKSASGADRAAFGRRLLNIVALENFLDQHFRKKPSGQGAR